MTLPNNSEGIRRGEQRSGAPFTVPESAALVVREVLGTSGGAVQHVPPVDYEIAHDRPNESETESVA